jgi:pilus assembly protein CpaF
MIRFDKKNISPTNPRVECRMADGSRLTCMIPPTANRPYINIRKFASFKISTENYIKSGTFNKEMADYLQKLVKGRANIIISGETNSGKTTLLKYLIDFINPKYRLGVIETHFELKLDETYPERNIVCFEAHEEDPVNVSMKDLFVSMLRFSPDIIIIGEARSTEAEEMIKAMRRGHQGSIGTIHSSSPELAIADIMDMINEDGKARNAEMLLKKVTNAIDIIIQLRRFEDGTRRITKISEIWATPESELQFKYEIRDLWEWVVDYTHPNNGYFRKVNQASDQLKAKLYYYGLTEEEVKTL